MLHDDAGPKNAPRVGAGVIECPGGVGPGKVLVKRNGGLSGKKCIEAVDQLPDGFVPTLTGIPETDGAANLFFWAPDPVTHLLDLG